MTAPRPPHTHLGLLWDNSQGQLSLRGVGEVDPGLAKALQGLQLIFPLPGLASSPFCSQEQIPNKGLAPQRLSQQLLLKTQPTTGFG